MTTAVLLLANLLIFKWAMQVAYNLGKTSADSQRAVQALNERSSVIVRAGSDTPDDWWHKMEKEMRENGKFDA